MELLGSSDLNALAKTLLAAERRPITLLQTRRTEISARASAFDALGSSLSSLLTSARRFASPGALSPFSSVQVVSSRESVVSAVASSGASPVAHQVTVHSLASHHVLASRTLDSGAPLADSTETFTFVMEQPDGTTEVSVELNEGASLDTQLESVARAIRATDATLDAYVLKNGDERRLVVQSTVEGRDDRIVAIADTQGDLMGRLGLAGRESSGSPHAATTQAPGNASLTLDGIAIEASSNQISGVVPGLTLTLHAVSEEPVTLSVSRDNATTRAKLEEFLQLYNQTLDEVRSKTRASDGEGSQRGVLADFSLVSRLRTSMRTALTDSVGSLDGSVRALSDIGITTDREGHLTITDGVALDAALEGNLEGVIGLFQAEDGVAQRLEGLLDRYASTKGILGERESTARSQMRRIDRQIASIEDKIERRQETLLNRLAALQEGLNVLTGQSSFLNAFL